MLERMLKQVGYDVLAASNGNEGLKLYHQDQVDLVITDIFMPEKEGIQTVMELKEINPDVKIIAISGGGSLERLEYLKSTIDFGVHKTFEKPFVTKEFLAAIAELLDAD
ncbi:MAG: response regulator [Deltaproteobacteria bacterium]|nr:response regulator [Deltaproteobacteria bacterium]MBT7713780.1 response regulator [Deltaproteobacteria bacterium]